MEVQLDNPIYEEQLKSVLGHRFVEVLGGFCRGAGFFPLFIHPF